MYLEELPNNRLCALLLLFVLIVAADAAALTKNYDNILYAVRVGALYNIYIYPDPASRGSATSMATFLTPF